MKFPFIYLTLSLIISSGVCTKFTDGQYESAPHIIVFMVDDLGWNDVSYHGSSQIFTPNIDALAYNGIILNRHYTLPSCTPTRAAFLSGKYPIRMGMQGEGIMGGEPRGLPLNVRILPEHLRDLGYSPKLIGKWHLGFHTKQHTPLHRGFDHFLGFYNSHIAYYDYKYSQGNMSGFDLHRGDSPAYDIHDQYATDLFTEEAVRVIEHHDPINPLYLQLSHLGVHAPLEVPVDSAYLEDFAHIREPNRRNYALMVSRLDESLGRVVAALGDKNMLKNSIIIFMTDNGAPTIGKYRNSGSNWPLRGTKYTLYEGGVRGVAAVWSPRLHAMARVSNNLMHVTDWLPTLYSAAGGNVADLGEIDGVDHWPHLSQGKDIPRESLLLNIDEVSKTEGAIKRRFKLVRGAYKRGYYDQYYGESGRNHDTQSYNYTLVHSSVVSSAISAHLGDPMTQPSAMTHLREQATVLCKRKSTFSYCNETECLFDIVNDPCEATNIAKQYPKVVSELDMILEKYGSLLVKQPRLPIDGMADPRRRNNTWAPWLDYGMITGLYGYNYNAAAAVSTLAVCVHIGMALLIVSMSAFI
ncbi:arylsulfatase B [Microplitis demolitor]|uniref:arylsulfatase B n=1 Tax=Microplitis demolitor TaxID=69319 RepID=UPI0004CD13E1|nr:arylsulfatase B [Microplitis demolitor]